MSAPQGRQARSSSRGRGAGVKPRDPRHGSRDRQAGRLSPYSTTRGSEPRLSKPPPNTGHHRNKSWTKPPQHAPLTSAIQSHAGKISDPRLESWRKPGRLDSRTYKQRMIDYYQTLKQNRERERKDAIKDGFLADPDKPTSLANAITPVGTCQDMCPEFERVERIVQLMVDGSEKIPSPSDSNVKVPCEEMMVKRFRRSAAGYDEQLPSDIRPPAVLQNTLNYLINDIVGGPEPLAAVHKFVWDRTRGIRNDFSIQQVTKIEDLKIAIDCFERIARFHILSLHQLSQLQSEKGEFDAHQEREQLNNTLLSLMYYYDDSRHKLNSPNEAEFRAYCIVFEIQDQRPDLEDRAQNWPRTILKDPRVQTAFKLYAAAGNTADDQGPLRPRTQFLTAQANTGGFWALVRSNAVSYLMACVAEIYFNLIRRTALEAIWKAYKGKRAGPTKMEDWTLKDLTSALGFDTEHQTQVFCEDHDFQIAERGDGELFVDLGSVASGNLADQNGRRKQVFSKYLVEEKRLGRTLPAIINGLSASQAQAQGLIEDLTDAETGSVANSESLFVGGSSDDEGRQSRSRSGSPPKTVYTNGEAPKLNPSATPFNPFSPNTHGNTSKPNPFQTATTFRKPSSTPSWTPQRPATTFGLPSANSSSQMFQPSSAAGPFFNSKHTDSGTTGQLDGSSPSGFDFFAAANKTKADESTSASDTSGNKEPSKFNFFPPTSKAENINSSTGNSPFRPLDNSSKGVFGQPSTLFPNTIPTGSVKTSSDSPSTIPLATTQSPQPKSISDQSSKPTAPSKFSFATSPLFGIPENKPSDKSIQTLNQSATNDSEGQSSDFNALQEKDARPAKPLFPISSNDTNPTIFPPPPPPPAKLGAPAGNPPNNSTNLFPLFPNVNTNKSTPTSTPTIPSTSTGFPPSSSFPQNNLQNPSVRLENGSTLSKPPPFPATVPNNLGSAQTAFPWNVPKQSTSTIVESTLSQSNQSPLASTHSQLDSRNAALDDISNAVMRDDNGLLQQFIEYTVGPIIRSSMAQLQDESSWEEAKKNRLILLSKKYFRRWRVNAWNMGLMRKGRERRRNLARSIQGSAKNSPQRPSSSSYLFSLDSFGNTLAGEESPARLMPPPAEIPLKRQSLPADLGHGEGAAEMATGTKRKRDESLPSANELVPRPTKVHHRRSQTVGNSMSASPLRFSRPAHRARVDISKVPEGSMFHETLMKQARRLVPNTKSDTTRTDYFRLKALGIDPDTPIVPLTKERKSDAAQVNGDSPPSQSSPPDPSSRATKPPTSQNPTTNQKSQTPSKPPVAADEDEALFAQIRSVREALAESEQWMQSERQSIERSMTPKSQAQTKPQSTTPTSSSQPTNTETPAQRRLREIKERGHTPSRTEVRLRAMGDKALLPKGFWDGEGMGKSLYGRGGREQEPVILENGDVEDGDGEDDEIEGEGFEGQEEYDEEDEGEEEEEEDGEEYDEDETEDEDEEPQFGEQSGVRSMGFAALNAPRTNGQFSTQGRIFAPGEKTGASVEDAIEL